MLKTCFTCHSYNSLVHLSLNKCSRDTALARRGNVVFGSNKVSVYGFLVLASNGVVELSDRVVADADRAVLLQDLNAVPRNAMGVCVNGSGNGKERVCVCVCQKKCLGEEQ